MQSALYPQKLAAASLSIATNAASAVLKLGIGASIGSVGLMSDGAHSLSDLMASTMALYAVRVSNVPPDEDHAYGHGKVENLSALIQAGILLCAVGFIIDESVGRLIHHTRPGQVGWGMVAVGAGILINMGTLRVVAGIARRTDSPALRAAAQDHRADIYTALGVFLGLALVHFTGYGFFDPLVAMLIALLILRSAWKVLRDATRDLLDEQLPEKDLVQIREVFNTEPGVLGYHKVRTRKAGEVRFVDAHVFMDDHLSLLHAHNLAEKLEGEIRRLLPNSVVTLHTEPYHAEIRSDKAEADRPFDEVIKKK